MLLNTLKGMEYPFPTQLGCKPPKMPRLTRGGILLEWMTLEAFWGSLSGRRSLLGLNFRWPRAGLQRYSHRRRAALNTAQRDAVTGQDFISFRAP